MEHIETITAKINRLSKDIDDSYKKIAYMTIYRYPKHFIEAVEKRIVRLELNLLEYEVMKINLSENLHY